jgi:hypothetical protein
MKYLFIVFQMKAFTCMAIAQQKLIRSAGNFCVAIGMNGIFHKLKEFLCITLKFKTINISPHNRLHHLLVIYSFIFVADGLLFQLYYRTFR